MHSITQTTLKATTAVWLVPSLLVHSPSLLTSPIRSATTTLKVTTAAAVQLEVDKKQRTEDETSARNRREENEAAAAMSAMRAAANRIRLTVRAFFAATQLRVYLVLEDGIESQSCSWL